MGCNMAKVVGINSGRPRGSASSRRPDSSRIRYAVVGLGYIAQIAVLPAFKHSANSDLCALVSSDAKKLKELGKRYGVENLYSYEEYDAALNSGQFDAVYIALPNHQHRAYSERAARAGIHVLCEKPMAPTVEDCEAMIRTARQHRTKLMLAYRLHFEEANLTAIDLVNSGKIGQPRLFNSTFTQQVKEGDIRLSPNEKGGGTLYDIGIYCINAARNLFAEEPEQVTALAASGADARFRQSEENASAVLRFSEGKLATFTCGFGSADNSAYEVVGAKGSLRVDPGYEFVGELKHTLRIGDHTKERSFSKRDQFAPELIYFSHCILKDIEPEPSGEEGLADVRVIQALYESARSGRSIKLPAFERQARPGLSQQIKRPPVQKPRLVNAESPSGS